MQTVKIPQLLKKAGLYYIILVLFNVSAYAEVIWNNNTYTTIQQAIDAYDINAGGYLLVKNGVYNENLTINKPVILIGESKDGVVINALSAYTGYYYWDVNAGTNAITIANTKDVYIVNLTLTNATLSLTPMYSGRGIFITNSNNITLKNLRIGGEKINYTVNKHGILVMSSSNVYIENLEVNAWGTPIATALSNKNITIKNSLFNSSLGFNFIKSIDNLTVENSIFYGKKWGIIISEVNNSLIANNTIYSEDVEISIWRSINYSLIQNKLSAGIAVNGVVTLNASKLSINPTNETINNSLFFLDIQASLESGNSYATVRIYYNGTYMEENNINESTIQLWHYNGTDWVPLDTIVNETEDWLEANVTSFSPFAVTGEPYPDTDGDGLTDNKDSCPTQPENFNGYKDDDGCPDTKPVSGGGGSWTPPKPTLSLFPSQFKYSTYIIYGKDAAYEDKEIALKIAEYLGLSGSKVKRDIDLTNYEKSYNLILIGGAAVNDLVEELNPNLTYSYTNVEGMVWGYSYNGTIHSNQSSYVIEVLQNPYTAYESRYILIVSGLTREGTEKAASYLMETTELPEVKAYASWS